MKLYYFSTLHYFNDYEVHECEAEETAETYKVDVNYDHIVFKSCMSTTRARYFKTKADAVNGLIEYLRQLNEDAYRRIKEAEAEIEKNEERINMLLAEVPKE